MQIDQLKPKKAVIRWTEDEWDRLADGVCKTRKNSPDSIASIANRLQRQFPRDRQRPGILTTAALQPLVERVQKREREEQEKAAKCEQLAAKLTFFEGVASTRQELLTTLSDDEICQHFQPRLVQLMTPNDLTGIFSHDQLLGAMTTGDLAAVVARRIVEEVGQPAQVLVQLAEQRFQPPPQQFKPQSNGRQKKIVVIGVKGDEGRHVRDKVGHLCDLTFIEVEKLREENVPRNADLVVIWSKFVSHKHRTMVYAVVNGRKVYEHFFGTKELIKKIENVCRKEFAMV